MIKSLFLIPARGGSQGIPGKNLKPLAGKPLLYYTLDTARQLAPDADICLSTDSDEIIRAAADYGLSVPFKRPAELATNQAGSYGVLHHAVDFYQQQGRMYDVVVLLQPTSPFRTARHVREAMALYTPDLDMVVSVTESDLNPYFNLFEESSAGYLEPSKDGGQFVRRQDAPPAYAYNGAVYVINTASLAMQTLREFAHIKKYIMPAHDSVDLDTPLNWQFAEFLMQQREANAPK